MKKIAKKPKRIGGPRLSGARLSVEMLEDRNLMSVWGMAWPSATLTASFAPDGTDVDGSASALFQNLGASQASTWQVEILKALQTWAVNTNINIALVPDGGQALGTTGLTQGDARFGDIRVASQLMGTAPLTEQHLAIGSPYSPLAGTRAGDIIFNSAQPIGVGGTYDLFTVALHEAGHVFGFADDLTDQTSANYYGYLGVRSSLSANDISMLQSLYGARSADAYDAVALNESLATATLVSQPNIAGDITTAGDVDTYQYVVPDYAGSTITVTVQTAGVSLLSARLSVYDANQQLIATVAEADALSGDVSIVLQNAVPGAVYYFKVEGAQSNVFGIGAYRLKIDSGAVSQSEIAAIDLLLNASVATAGTSGSTLATAVALDQPTYSVDAAFNYAVNATLGAPTDTHLYSIVTPTGIVPQALLFTVTTNQAGGLNPKLTIYDANGQPVAAQVLSNDQGSFVVQVVGPTAGATYYVQVSPDAAIGGSAAAGTYVLGVSFRDTAIVLDALGAGTLSGTNNAQVLSLQSTEFQLYHFVLSIDTGAANANVAVRMNLYDENNQVILTLDVRDGETVSANVALNRATYYARFFSATSDGSALPNVSFQLAGVDLTDPMDPIPIDPSDPTLPPPPPPSLIVGVPETPPLLPPLDPTSNPWTPTTTTVTTTTDTTTTTLI